jgi:Phage tail protein
MTAAIDVGYWTGSLSYQPSWASSPFVINFGQVDANGTAWILQEVKGWDSAPSAVGQVTQKSADHGGYPTAQFYGPRIITLTVMASAPSQALRDVARAQLQQCVPISDLAVFTYAEPIPLLAYVRRNAGAGVDETYMTLTDVQFSIPLVAPDPRKYATVADGGSSQAPAAVTLLTLPFTALPVTFPAGIPAGLTGILAINAGTFETRPIVQVNGPVTSPSIINGAAGQAVTFTGLVMGSSDVLVLDMDARQAFLNDVFIPADASSSWWVLQPGESLIYMTGTSDAGSIVQATWSSAWI